MIQCRRTRRGIRTGQGIAAQIVAFFHTNADEELTIADVAIKFGLTERRAQQEVARAMRSGTLEWFRTVRLKTTKPEN